MKYKNIIPLLALLFFFSLSYNAYSQQIEAEAAYRNAQYQQSIQPKWCGTEELQHNIDGRPEDVEILNRLYQFRSITTWSVTDGYGDGCTITSCTAISASSCSGSQSGVFRVPVVYTLSTTTGCATSAPSTNKLTEMIDMMNDYYACEGIDIEYYLCDNDPSAPNGIRSGDYGCDYSTASLADIPDVINIYVFSNTGNGTGCNGFAPLPFSVNSDIDVAMSHACYNGFSYSTSVSCATINASLGLGVVLIHEMGHYFGLFHTHDASTPNGGVSDNPNMTSDDCDNGDLIKDTDEDPDWSGGELGVLNCNTGGSTSNCAFNNSGHSNCSPYLNGGSDPNTIDNIMSYNNYSNCRSTLTPCQKTKMLDALLCVRGLQMCCRDVDMEFAGGASDATQEICVDETVPTFTATSDCYTWYDGLGSGATALATNSSTFTPATGTAAGEVDNTTPGTYTYYLGDYNEVNPDCRTTITVIVSADPGDGDSNVDGCVDGTGTVNLTSIDTDLGTNEVVGWWITGGTPISTTVTNQTSMDANLPASAGGTVSGNSPNLVFQSTSGSDYDLPIDCSMLTPAQTYYATPFVSSDFAGFTELTCNGSFNSSPVTVSGSPGAWVTNATVACPPGGRPTPAEFDIEIDVTTYAGTANQLTILFRNAGTCSGTVASSFGNAGVGTYNFDETDFSVGTDPTNGFCIILYDQTLPATNTIVFDVDITITYPAVPAAPFPSVTYTSCVFGTPITIECTPDCMPVPVELISFSGKKEGEMVRLNWETASEENNDYFILEYATNSRDFEHLAKVDGVGTSYAINSYSHLHRQPAEGMNYYRLIQVDLDGVKSVVSNIVAVKYHNDKAVSVRPNPINENVLGLDYTSAQSGTVQLEAYDITGRKILSQKVSVEKGDNYIQLQLPELSNGIYILHTIQNEDVRSTRFVKTR